jgi:arsenate reductase (glutaredoxin)
MPQKQKKTTEIIIYHKPNCVKSNEALALLKKKKIKPVVIEYLIETPTPEELSKIITKLKIKPEELVRKKESFYKEKLIGKKFSDKKWIEILCKNPILIERPIIVKGNKAVIGRPTEKILEII